jgi:hypothetical protein
MKIKKKYFLFLFLFFLFCCCFFILYFKIFGSFCLVWFYGVALHLNSFSGSSASVSASESVVQSFEEESVVHSDKKLTDEFSNKRLDTLESVDGSDVGKGDAGKYGVETMLTVSSPFMSRIGERAAGNILV